MDCEDSEKELSESINGERRGDIKPKGWDSYIAFVISCAITIVLTFLGAVWRCKVLTHMIVVSFLGLAVVFLCVFTSKEWKSIIATVLTLPIVVYIIYNIFLLAD